MAVMHGVVVAEADGAMPIPPLPLPLPDRHRDGPRLYEPRGRPGAARQVL